MFDNPPALAPNDEVFEYDETHLYLNSPGEVIRSFHIPTLQWLIDCFPQMVQETRTLIQQAKQYSTQTYDPDVAMDLPDASLERPGFLCEYNSGLKLLVDGNHRLARREIDGALDYPIIIIPQKLWVYSCCTCEDNDPNKPLTRAMRDYDQLKAMYESNS